MSTEWIPAFAGMTGVSEGIPSQMTLPPERTIAFRDARLYVIGRSKIEKGNSGLLGFRPSRHRVSQGLVIPASSHLA